MKVRYLIFIVFTGLLVTVPLLWSSEHELEEVTIAEARELDDDTKVLLEGYIVEKVRDEYYIFRDETDEIELEIEDHHWGDNEMDPEQVVHIYGEVDRDDGVFTIEVDRLEFHEAEYP